MKRLADLRAFLAELAAMDDLVTIESEVDWNLELGAVIRRSYDLRAPAPLFTNITGIEAGYRALGAPGGLRADPATRYARIAVALGLPPTAGGRDIIDALDAAMGRPGMPPRIVNRADAPCREVVLVGDAVDLMRFPSPLIHQGDGGRYLQTYGLNMVRTPDGSWTNASVNRMMLVDRNRLACLIPPNQHLGIIHAMWRERGEPTPVAVVLGTEPALPFVGGMPLDQGVSELDYLGAYWGEPVDVVPCETVPLEVPATAEIVIEGHISHTDTVMEGPMSEYPGYLPNPAGSPKPVLHVTAVTHRRNPILPVVTAGTPVEENHTAFGLPHAADCQHLLRAAGLPVTAVWMVLESACHWLAVAVADDWHTTTGLDSRELGQRVGELVFGAKAGFGVPKILLVEDDFDITDVSQLVWAFASRAHPSHGEIYFRDEAQNNLPVFLDPREKFGYHTTKVVHNCLLGDHYDPADRPIASDLHRAWPPEIVDRVLTNWTRYGYQPVRS